MKQNLQPRLSQKQNLRRTIIYTAGGIGIVAILIFSGVFLFNLFDSEKSKAANPSNFSSRAVLTISSANVYGSGSHTDFPVLVTTTQDYLKHVSNGGSVEHNDGYDIYFYAADASTKLSHELVSYDPATGELTAWVNLPSLSTASNTSFFLYFGNSNISSNPSTTATWNSNYKSVWHLDGNGITAEESSPEGNSGNINGASQIQGKIGSARSFDGINDYIATSEDLSLWLGESATLHAWIKTTASGHVQVSQAPGITGVHHTSQGNQIYWGFLDNQAYVGGQAGSVTSVKSNTTVDDNSWHLFTMTRDASSGEIIIYLDGEVENSGTSATGTISQSFYSLGRIEHPGASSPKYFDGILDEIRISNSIRNAGWIRTEYESVNNSSFISYSPAENNDGSALQEGFAYGFEVLIDHTKVTGSSDLNDFPVLIDFQHEDLKTKVNGGNMVSPDGHDVQFYSSDTVALDFDIESYDADSGRITAWVKVPVLSTSKDTKLFLYYSDPTVTSDPSSEVTWNSDYAAIWHLHDSNFDDATANNRDGTYSNSTDTEGNIAGGRSFDGNNDYIDLNSFGISSNTITMSAWFNANSLANDGYILAKAHHNGHSNHRRFMIGTISSGQFATTINTGSGNDYSTYNLNTNEWYYGVVTFDGSNVRMFINGNLEATYSLTGSLQATAGNDVWLGANPGSSREFDGLIDEVRISNVSLSADWIRTEYNNQNEPETFFSTTNLGALGSGGNTLPVELAYFRAEPMPNQQVRLIWGTAMEINNDFFQLERKTDDSDFEAIGIVYGAGNSNVHLDYEFIDDGAKTGNNYYRIKQVDYNGVFEYLPIRMISFEAASEPVEVINVGPNPFQSEFTMEYNAGTGGNMEILIHSINGQEVYRGQMTGQEGMNTYRFSDRQGLEKGVYLITIIQDDQRSASYRVVKQ